jgi:hypothetical protein
MEMSMYDPRKARLKTLEVAFPDKNTTWFDGCTDNHDIYMITDAGGGLSITEFGYSYPIWNAGESRAPISFL